MKLKRNSLGVKIWLYLCLFSLLILAFLWLFQVLFLNTYYEWVKSKQIRTLASDLRNQYKDNDWTKLLDDMAYEKGICIEVSKDNRTIYTSSAFNRGCMINSDRNPSILYYAKKIFDNNLKKMYESEDKVKMIDNLNNVNSQSESDLDFKNAIPNLLVNIQSVIPENVQLTEIENTEENDNRHIIIKAKSEYYEELGYFKVKLKEDGILTNVVSTESNTEDGFIQTIIEGDLL